MAAEPTTARARGVGTRLAVGFGVTIVGGAVVAALALFPFRVTVRESTSIASAGLDQSEHTRMVRDRVLAFEDELEELAEDGQASAAPSVRARMHELDRAIDEMPGLDERDELAAVAAVQRRWGGARATAQQLLDRDCGDGACADLVEEAFDQLDVLTLALTDLERARLAQNRERLSAADGREASAQQQVVVASIVSVVLAAALWYWITRSIVHPLRRLRSAVERLATGDLGQRSGIDRRDEIGQLSGSIDAMAERLQKAQVQLEHRALHDVLTGLPNRALLLDRLDRSVSRTEIGSRSPAVLWIDVDGFKTVNDTFGHAAGDEVLVQIAARLVDEAGAASTVGRLGGDEFAVLLEEADADGACAVAEQLRAAICAPVEVEGARLYLDASIGIALAAMDPGDANAVLRNADLAMYEAKRTGRGALRIFEPSMLAAARQRADAEVELRLALDEDQLELHYQPIVEVGSGIPTGVEALVRWIHPVRGTISPVEFVPVAERSGLIVPLGRWVLRQACHDATRLPWPHPLHVSVNVAVQQLRSPDFLQDVRDALASSGLPPADLVLEITETTMMDGPEVRQRLNEIHDLGVRIGIDDFGTGYSSLSYLRRFPVDILKIDRSFVSDLERGGGAMTVASAITGVAKGLGIRTVAEGVETEGQARALAVLGCQCAQGFLYARPVPMADLAAALAGCTGGRSLPEPGDTAATAVVVLDAEGRVVEMNPAAELLLGHRAADRRGTNGLDLVHPDDFVSAVERFAVIGTGAYPDALRLRLRHGDGHWIVLDAVAEPAVDGSTRINVQLLVPVPVAEPR